ncbi:MAG: FGGY-family carbohydrate kinase, partial [Bacilli bacterium]
FPSIKESLDVVGSINSSNDYLNKALVVMGGGDQAVGAIGVGIANEGKALISLGTSGVVFVACNQHFVDKKYQLHSFAHANGKYHVMGVTLNAAASLTWWYQKILGNQNFDELESILMQTNTKDLYFLPYLTGERTPIHDSKAKGLFLGMDINTTSAMMSKSVIEGVCFSLRQCLDIVIKSGISINELRVLGGGAQSKQWLNILSKVMQRPIEVLQDDIGPSYGACLLAMATYQKDLSLEQIMSQFIKVDYIINPNNEDMTFYELKYQKYLKLYPALKDLY